MCWLHPCSTGRLFLGNCQQCLSASVVPAGGQQLLLPAQPITALPIKAALHVLVPPIGDEQMLLSSEAGNSPILAFDCVLGQASPLWSWTPAGLHL